MLVGVGVLGGFRLAMSGVGDGELAFLGWGVSALGFLRGLWTVITQVDSKLRSLETPACAGLLL